jgi:hypothetical protein
MQSHTSGPVVRLSNGAWLLVLILFVAACSSEELAEPAPVEPVPDLPELICAPFIKSGYTDKVSYLPGENIKAFFDSKESTSLCLVTIFNVNGDSVLSVGSQLPIVPQLTADAFQTGFNFPVAVEFKLPELESGVYLIEKKIPFIVKTRERVDAVVVYPSNTANAYANSGGKSLYSTQQRPASVSFQRPIALQAFSAHCLRWFTTLDDVRIGYLADSDMDDFVNLQNAGVIVIPGHSEYWTRKARENFDRFVDLGGHAVVLSGNTMWWQVRYSDDNSQLICYKDGTLDPVQDPLFKTVEWSTPLLEYPILSSIGAHFPFGGYGMKTDTGWNGYKIVAPSSPLFEGLNLNKGDIISLPTVEYDGAPIVSFDVDGYPVVDKNALNFTRIELLGFDKGFRVNETIATFIVFQKTESSGIIINAASTDWCSANGMGGSSGSAIKAITYNSITKLVSNAPVFTQ